MDKVIARLEAWFGFPIEEISDITLWWLIEHMGILEVQAFYQREDDIRCVRESIQCMSELLMYRSMNG